MGGEELELFARAAAGARYSEPIKLEGLNQTAGDQVSLSPKIEEPSNLTKGKTQAAVGR